MFEPWSSYIWSQAFSFSLSGFQVFFVRPPGGGGGVGGSLSVGDNAVFKYETGIAGCKVQKRMELELRQAMELTG